MRSRPRLLFLSSGSALKAEKLELIEVLILSLIIALMNLISSLQKEELF